ncbi:hypothetical protein HZ326_27137 [Fusarium oxysporum f. sp. albedinis]|nr:hypothetical protein HZ326_27137 [Fusarium oxysporum f. sp. albedinis]
MLSWRPFPLPISTIDVDGSKRLSAMELRQHQIHDHTSPSAGLAQVRRWDFAFHSHVINPRISANPC